MIFSDCVKVGSYLTEYCRGKIKVCSEKLRPSQIRSLYFENPTFWKTLIVFSIANIRTSLIMLSFSTLSSKSRVLIWNFLKRKTLLLIWDEGPIWYSRKIYFKLITFYNFVIEVEDTLKRMQSLSLFKF